MIINVKDAACVKPEFQCKFAVFIKADDRLTTATTGPPSIGPWISLDITIIHWSVHGPTITGAHTLDKCARKNSMDTKIMSWTSSGKRRMLRLALELLGVTVVSSLPPPPEVPSDCPNDELSATDCSLAALVVERCRLRLRVTSRVVIYSN